MKTIYISIILLIGFYIQASAQEKSSYEKQGDSYCFNYSYDKAIVSYTKAKDLTIDGQRKLAESYHNLENNTKAEEVYSKLILAGNNILPEDYYNYATILKINRKYDLYNIWMTKFYEVSPNDLRAIDFNKNQYEFSELAKDKAAFKITHLNINTAGEDFGTCFYKDKVVFASSRGGSSLFVRKDNWTGVPYSDLYISNVENGQLSKPELFDSKFNSALHDGPASFSNNGTFMVYTKNNAKDKTNDKIVELQIYMSTFKNGEWSKPEPFFLNNKDYSVGQPCLTEDGNTMYFTSDMPGGFGGADIYRVSKNEIDVWGQAQNLGPAINTEGDEMFPYVEEKNQFLFFTSNGRFGLGGLDIFSSKINGFAFDSVRNVGYPLNTEFDDFALILNDSTQTGYFSSNRTGGSGNDDIYAVSFLKEVEVSKQIIGYAIDENKVTIPNAFITLYNADGSVQDTLTTKGFESYTFSINSNKYYRIVGNKEFYREGDTSINSFGAEQVIKADVILFKETPKEIVAKKIKVGADLAKVLDFTPGNIYFDYGKSNIRPDAVLELDKIVEVMNDYPKMVIQLGAYTDCRSSEGFNQKLSDRRAKSTVAYISKRISTPGRITGKGYGETNPIVMCTSDDVNKTSDCTEEQHQQNRRSEFIIMNK
jgi:outer membrane protein OmpA-like peptidoglycan-associated protein/tetratricopeptide (TPR) repeat protein